MEHKRTKKSDGSGFYIAICCCILVIALIGYANNVSRKNAEEQKLLTEEAGEATIVPEITPAPTATPTAPPVQTKAPEKSAAPSTEPAAKAKKVVEEPVFAAPVGGGIVAEFSEKQVYNEALGDWRTHNGADFAAQVGESVAAAADGVVCEVYMGSLGYTVSIDHGDGIVTSYSNLDENSCVALGDSVKKGDVVGHVGQSALGDMAEGAHLHFEVTDGGKYRNPAELLQ